jgi:F-type H+-transporting ATPase subunit beta
VVDDDLVLNVPLLRRRVPNLTAAARSVGLRPATVSDLCTGKIPVGRAEVRTLVALASLAGCTLDELVLRVGLAGMVETGIKVLDLFAPQARGGTVGLVSRKGLGQLVVTTELMRRLRSRYEYSVILWLPSQPLPAADEILPYASATAATVADARALVAEARIDHDVLLAADRETVVSGALLELRESLRTAPGRPVTVALFDLRGETPDIEAPYGPLDTLWRFDPELAVRHRYPAIDPIGSTSVLLESGQLGEEHVTLASRARATLRRYRELRTLVPVLGLDRFPQPEQTTYHRGERLEAFLSQPLFSAETATGRPGLWVSLEATLSGVGRILNGASDRLDVAALRDIGDLDGAVPGP